MAQALHIDAASISSAVALDRRGEEPLSNCQRRQAARR